MAKMNGNHLSSYDELMAEIESSETNYDLFRVLRVICNEYQCNNFLVSELPKDNEFLLQEILIVSNWDPELIREYDLGHAKKISYLFDSLRASINPVPLRLPMISSSSENVLQQPCDGSRGGDCIFFPVFDRIGRKGMIGYSINRSENPNRIVNLGFLSNFIFDKIMEIKKIANVQNNSLRA